MKRKKMCNCVWEQTQWTINNEKILSKNCLFQHAWKLDLISGLNTTDNIGFNHAVDTIEISESTLTCKCLVLSCPNMHEN